MQPRVPCYGLQKGKSAIRAFSVEKVQKNLRPGGPRINDLHRGLTGDTLHVFDPNRCPIVIFAGRPKWIFSLFRFCSLRFIHNLFCFDADPFPS